MSIRLNAQQIAAEEYKNYDPDRFDFVWNADFTECEVHPLTWWDEASYAAYQGDCHSEPFCDADAGFGDGIELAPAMAVAVSDESIPF